MKTKLLRITALVSPLLLVFVLLQTTGCPAPPDEEKKVEQTKDGGNGDTTKDDTKTDTTQTDNSEPTTTTDADGGTPEPTTDKDGGTTDGPICPPGCGSPECKSAGPEKLKLGDSCTLPTAGQEDPCDTTAGLKCLETRVLNGRFYRPVTLCLKTCNADSDCDAGNGETCNEPNPAGESGGKACGQYKKVGEPCDATLFALCEQPSGQAAHCLVADINNDNNGICTLNCAQDATVCDANSGKVCRKPIPDAVTSYCLDPVLPGPKCLGEKCDISSNITNCLSGLTCQSGFCVKECTKTTEQQDCDTAGGETCFVPFGAPKGLCQPPPSVTKEGEECTPLKRCDESIGLACISTGDKSICVKKCNTADGEKNNTACGTDQLCQKPSDAIAFGVCRNPAKLDEACGVTSVCTDVPSACITVSQEVGATCLNLCDPKKNKSEEDASNPDCDGGKGRCLTLNGAITSGGNSYNGACAPARPKTVDPGGGCDLTEKDGLRSPDCKDGSVCVNFGPPTGSVCLNTCDQCKQTQKGPDWVSAECGGDKACLSLTNGQGICLPDGKPTRGVGEYCDNFKNGCKDPDNVVCVRFSNDDDAQSVCSQRCNPSKGTNSNPDCPSQGQCGGLTGGGGVCVPTPKRSRKLGETCNGPIGTPRFDACLETDGGNDLICAEPNIPGLVGTCQVGCNATKGFKDNADCKAKGLNNHLCLPGDLTQPQKGACVEICSFSNRKDCSQQQCKYGQCREMILGTRGDCTDATKEKECTDKGGACVNKTCLATVCL